MELKEGMYVRVKEQDNTLIVKVTEIDKLDNEGFKADNNMYYLIYDIIRASENIIDLIQIGDYVNGKRVYNISIVDGLKYLDIDVEDYSSDLSFINADQITSIVTKEQFNSMQYEVK